VQTIQFAFRTQPMYNLTVEGAHTFFVGDKQWLVHNAPCGGSFAERNIRTSDKFWDRLKGNRITEEEALKAYDRGTKYTDALGNRIRYDARTGVALMVDADDGGVISAWTTDHPSRNWAKGWIEP
jgi:hypothetical protein